jgi:hypothetical protein
MKRLIFVASLLMDVLVPATLLAVPSVFPTGTTIYKPEKCWNGFTILSGQDGRLIDMNGNLVKTWPGADGTPNKIYPGGHLMRSHGAWKYGHQDMINVQIRDFNDEVIWSFNRWHQGTDNSDKGKMWLSRQHHDFQIKGNPVGYYIPGYITPNFKKGIVLVLSHHNPKNDKINKQFQLVDDIMYEVDMATGKVIWSWNTSDHFDEMGFDEDAIKAFQAYTMTPPKEGGGFDWSHQNCASYLGPNKWYDQGDQRFHPDNIILDSCKTNVLLIVDHKTGKVVWRCGPYYREGGDKQLGWIVGPHHTHMIPKGLPGEGNILVYDNGGRAGYGLPNDMAPKGINNIRRYYSRSIEFDPIAKKIVWEHSPRSLKMSANLLGYKEFSPFISANQRLPNGNTLITEGSNGRLIEVTKDLEVVWEYISPYLTWRNTVYRAYRVPYDWVPQLSKPREVAVDPGQNFGFQIPAVDGSKPDVGHGKTKMWKHGVGKQ